VHWVQVRGEAFFEGEGPGRRAVRFVGTVADIDERKQAPDALRRAGQERTKARLQQTVAALQLANERLRDNEERIRLLNLATHDVIWDWDLTTDELNWNDSLDATFGYRLSEVPGHISWWYDHLHPEDRARVVGSIHAVIEDPQQQVWTAEYRFLHRQGRWADVLDRGFLARDERGRGVRMFGSMLDVSERTEAERRLRNLLEASPMGPCAGASPCSAPFSMRCRWASWLPTQKVVSCAPMRPPGSCGACRRRPSPGRSTATGSAGGRRRASASGPKNGP
jgi:PAS domain S-box-containing protein